ncbi:hypothetical protein Tco_0271010 [Tanacetum coccineum]
MNEDYYHEQNSCYDPNSFGFDQFQPPQYTVNHPFFNDQNDLLNSQNELLEQLTSMRDMVGQYIQKKEEEKRIEEEQAAKARYWKIPVCYDDDDDEESSIPLKNIISGLLPYVAITPDSPKKDSLIMEDEHLSTIPKTESDEFIKSSVENLVQIPNKFEDSSEGECDLPPYDDSSKNHDLTFSNPLFDIDEDFTSTFYLDDDHIEEISSGSTTTHYESSLSKYDSFIFDLSINPFPPADMSDLYHEELAGELAHIISPPEYDCFCFKNEPELGDFTMDVVGDIYPTREPRVHVPNVLPNHPTLHLDLDFILFSDSLFAYIVWIFLPFLTYLVAPPYLLSCGNEDTIFDPDIPIHHSFMPGCPGFLKPLGFVINSPRALNPQLHLGIRYPNLID